MIRRLEHENGEARSFYRDLPKPSLIGIEATGYTQWFERMVAELGHELWGGRSGGDSGPGGPAAEDGQAGRGAPAGFAAEPEIPAGVGADPGGARSAATAEASGQAGAPADVGEEPTALSGDESGGVPEDGRRSGHGKRAGTDRGSRACR